MDLCLIVNSAAFCKWGSCCAVTVESSGIDLLLKVLSSLAFQIPLKCAESLILLSLIQKEWNWNKIYYITSFSDSSFQKKYTAILIIKIAKILRQRNSSCH